MSKVRWTQEAYDALDHLTAADARVLDEKLEMLLSFPQMYPVRQRGPFAGLRYLVLRRRWVPYYRLHNDGAITFFDLVPARARP